MFDRPCAPRDIFLSFTASMGSGCSSPGDTEDTAQDRIAVQVLRKNDPVLYERLMSQVSREVEGKCTRGQRPEVEQQRTAQSVPDVRAAVFSDLRPAGPSQADTKLGDYEFPFENLVFEGGGGKCQIYFGALKCLHEAGIKGKRFAGASAGAITATLLALDLPLDVAQEYMSLDMTDILNDASCGYLSFFPNLLRYFGWSRGERFLDFFGHILEKHAGNKDITFEQLYRKSGKELCVVAVNTNLQSLEYFHVKTTPHMSVRLAVRMSMSLPGYFAPVPWPDSQSRINYYIDGGVLCNYPVHIFDGWWLSLKPEDSFFKKLRPLSSIPRLLDKAERFGTFNEKTLGFVVYAADEYELHQIELEKRSDKIYVPRPDTPLFRKWQAKVKGEFKPLLAHAALSRATDKLFEALRDADLLNDRDEIVSKSEFNSVFSDLKKTDDKASGKFTETDAILLFGDGFDVNKIFNDLDLDGDGVISYTELCAMLDNSLCWNQRFLGSAVRREIASLKEFVKVSLSALQMHSKKVYVTRKDLDRTVGLYTDYVGTMDFTLDTADGDFLTQRGYETTKAFLLDYAAKSPNSRPGKAPGAGVDSIRR